MKEMGGTKKALWPGAPQDPARYHNLMNVELNLFGKVSPSAQHYF